MCCFDKSDSKLHELWVKFVLQCCIGFKSKKYLLLLIVNFVNLLLNKYRLASLNFQMIDSCFIIQSLFLASTPPISLGWALNARMNSFDWKPSFMLRAGIFHYTYLWFLPLRTFFVTKRKKYQSIDFIRVLVFSLFNGITTQISYSKILMKGLLVLLAFTFFL